MVGEELTAVLVDDHALFRAGLAVLLNKIPEIGQIHEFGEGQQAVDFVKLNAENLDLLILDYSLPDLNGVEILKHIKQIAPEIPVILMSANVDTSLIQSVINLSASGFIPKTASPDVMTSAIQLVLSGGIYIPPEAIGNSTSRAAGQTAVPTVGNEMPQAIQVQLTQRQKDVLDQMQHGLSNKEIARNLNMSPSTVKVHVAAILKEFQVSSRTQAVIVAKNHGLLG